MTKNEGLKEQELYIIIGTIMTQWADFVTTIPKKVRIQQIIQEVRKHYRERLIEKFRLLPRFPSRDSEIEQIINEVLK